MVVLNEMKLEFSSRSANEALARSALSQFAAQLDPTLDELNDIKTSVSEAVTNAIIHGYEGTRGVVVVSCKIIGNELEITVEDTGHGIEDIAKAMQPLYTGRPDEERSGMGFTVMETFMDTLKVVSELAEGTKVIMTKTIKAGQE